MLNLWLRRCDFAKRRFLQASPTRMQGFRSLHLSGVKFEVRCASEIALNSIIQITRFEPGSSLARRYMNEDTNSEFPKFYETRDTSDTRRERIGRTSRTSSAALPWRSRPGTKAGGSVNPTKIHVELEISRPSMGYMII